MRASSQRTLVLSIIKADDRHPAADEIYLQAKRVMPNISLGTVYRNLKTLVQDGQIREIRFGTGPCRYDAMLEAHEHFVCQTCSTVFDIRPTLEVPSLPGKQVTGYRLDYYGTCEACSDKKA